MEHSTHVCGTGPDDLEPKELEPIGKKLERQGGMEEELQKAYVGRSQWPEEKQASDLLHCRRVGCRERGSWGVS